MNKKQKEQNKGKQSNVAFMGKESGHNVANYRFKKSNKCWRCGFEGCTEWHHFNPPCWYEVEEICSMCHRNSKQSLKKSKIGDLVKGLKNGVV